MGTLDPEGPGSLPVATDPETSYTSGSGTTRTRQDFTPRSLLYEDDAQRRQSAPARTYDPRDFSDYEDTEHWWLAVALYGTMIFTVGSLQQAANFGADLVALLGVGLMVFVALLVLLLAGMEAGVAVFVGGATLLAASLPGLSDDTVNFWWALLGLVLVGSFLMALGGVMALRYHRMSTDEDRVEPSRSTA